MEFLSKVEAVDANRNSKCI